MDITQILRTVSGEGQGEMLSGLGPEVKKFAKDIKNHQRLLQIANIEVSYNSFRNKLESEPFDVF